MLKKIKDYDFILLFSPLILAGFGIVMIYSASMVTAVVEGFDSTHYLVKQSQWFVVGLAGFIIFSIIPYKKYDKLVKWIILASLLSLIGVLLFGDERGNATRWLELGPISIQPTEFVKLGIVMYLASVYAKKQAYINDFKAGVLPPLIMTTIIIALVLKQPDIGSSVTIFLISATIVISSGMRFKHAFLLGCVSLLLVLIATPYMITDERVSRFTGAYQPFEDPEESGHHLIQSYIALGEGGVTGEGLGQSVQKLGFLFGAHTDFIMSVIVEELGIFGVVIVIGLLAAIVLRGIYISVKCKDSFGALLAIGISSMVGFQALINLGSISGLLPITGITLPFISYGGSSLLVLMVSMGILNNIAASVKQHDGNKYPVSNVPTRQDNKHFSYNRGGRQWSS